MPYTTVESLCKTAIGEAHQIHEHIPDDFIQRAVNAYNASEPFIWRKWPWQNRKVDQFDASPDSNGVIVFDGDHSDVDIVRGIKALDSSGDMDVLVWNEDEIRAAIAGSDISSEAFQHLSDDGDGNRRIRVNVDDEVTTYKVLAFRRFIKAVGPYDAGFDGDNPGTNDYRTLTWKIDRAEASLISFMVDELKGMNGSEKTGKWNHALNGTLKDLKEQQAGDRTFAPDEGAFGEMGDWH